MFDAIAGRYDLLNRVLSGGLDRGWRGRAIAALGLTGRETVLDLCTGTADLALAAASGPKRAKRVIGVDFAAAMLLLGKKKVRGSFRDPPSILFAAMPHICHLEMRRLMRSRSDSASATWKSRQRRAARSRASCVVTGSS